MPLAPTTCLSAGAMSSSSPPAAVASRSPKPIGALRARSIVASTRLLAVFSARGPAAGAICARSPPCAPECADLAVFARALRRAPWPCDSATVAAVSPARLGRAPRRVVDLASEAPLGRCLRRRRGGHRGAVCSRQAPTLDGSSDAGRVNARGLRGDGVRRRAPARARGRRRAASAPSSSRRLVLLVVAVATLASRTLLCLTFSTALAAAVRSTPRPARPPSRAQPRSSGTARRTRRLAARREDVLLPPPSRDAARGAPPACAQPSGARARRPARVFRLLAGVAAAAVASLAATSEASDERLLLGVGRHRLGARRRVLGVERPPRAVFSRRWRGGCNAARRRGAARSARCVSLDFRASSPPR